MSNTADTNDLKNKIASKEAATGKPSQAISPYRSVEAMLSRLAPEISKALPKHLSIDRLTRITLTTIKLNPQLLEAPIESLLGAVMQASQLGLEPNLLGSCYFIPRKSHGQMTVSFQIGYRGMIDLARRSGELSYISAEAVYKKDKFDYKLGTDAYLHHVPSDELEMGEITHFYAVAHMKDGSKPFKVMPVAKVNAIRDEFASFKNRQTGQLEPTNIWAKHYEAMGQKTVIKQLIKMLPISVEVLNNIEMDGRSFTGINEHQYADDTTYEPIDITPASGEWSSELGDLPVEEMEGNGTT